MQCSRCGKRIPFAGEICPYCHCDKSKDQKTYALMIILGLAGGALGGFLFDYWGAFIGGFCGGAIALFL